MGVLDAINRDVCGLVNTDRFGYGGKARLVRTLHK